MEIRVLGSLRVTVMGSEVPLPAKQGILLAVLALQADRTVSTDRLIQALWGEDASPGLVKTLQTHVFQLRRRLQPGACDANAGAGQADEHPARIVTDRHGYRLEIGAEAVDASAFVDKITVARSPRLGDPAETIALLTSALSMWDGPGTADVGGDRVAEAEIVRLEELRASAVEEVLRLRLAFEPHETLTAELRRAIGESPFREHLWACLMVALARTGRRPEALLAYRDAEAALRRELDVEPSHELQELAARIRADDPTLAEPIRLASGFRIPALERTMEQGDDPPAPPGSTPHTGSSSRPALRPAHMSATIAVAALARARALVVGLRSRS